MTKSDVFHFLAGNMHVRNSPYATGCHTKIQPADTGGHDQGGERFRQEVTNKVGTPWLIEGPR